MQEQEKEMVFRQDQVKQHYLMQQEQALLIGKHMHKRNVET